MDLDVCPPPQSNPLPLGLPGQEIWVAVSCSDHAPKLTTHSASSNLNTSVSIDHHDTDLPRYNLDKISIFLAQPRTHSGGHDSS